MLKNLNDKRTRLRDLDGKKPSVIDEEALRLVAGGAMPTGGPTCTTCNDTDGSTSTFCNDED